MNKKAKIAVLMSLGILAFLLYFQNDFAEAARVGGGKSFGSSPSYQRSTPAPSPSPTSPQVSPTQPTPQRPVASPAPSLHAGRTADGWSYRFASVWRRSCLGRPRDARPLVGGGLFLLYRFIHARRMANAAPAAAGSMSFDSDPAHSWGESGYAPAAEPTTSGAEQTNLPPGFDVEEFLKGAKIIYTRLQASWDKRDMEDIRQFVSPEVLSEIQKQAQEDPKPVKTELLLINPRILEVREVATQTVVSVFYDVMMRENRAGMAKQVREVWHFSRDSRKPEDFWVLEGIQQVD
jgi:hypothetical protein